MLLPLSVPIAGTAAASRCTKSRTPPLSTSLQHFATGRCAVVWGGVGGGAVLTCVDKAQPFNIAPPPPTGAASTWSDVVFAACQL